MSAEVVSGCENEPVCGMLSSDGQPCASCSGSDSEATGSTASVNRLPTEKEVSSCACKALLQAAHATGRRIYQRRKSSAGADWATVPPGKFDNDDDPAVHIKSAVSKSSLFSRACAHYYAAKRVARGLIDDACMALCICVSMYAFPHTVCKLASWANLEKRRRYPLMGARDMLGTLRQSVILYRQQPLSAVSASLSVEDETAGQKPTLLSLPPEVLINVATFMNAGDLANLMATCRKMHEVVDCQFVWRRLLVRDFLQRLLRVHPDWDPRRRPSDDSRRRPINFFTQSLPKSQYKMLADTAFLTGSCACDPLPVGRCGSCCYAARVRAWQDSWWAQNRVTAKQANAGRRAVFEACYKTARERLHHLPLTPIKLVSLAVSPAMLALSAARFWILPVEGMVGQLARDLYATTWRILQENPVDDAQWVMCVSLATLVSLAVHDADVALSYLSRDPLVRATWAGVFMLGFPFVYVLYRIWCA